MSFYLFYCSAFDNNSIKVLTLSISIPMFNLVIDYCKSVVVLYILLLSSKISDSVIKFLSVNDGISTSLVVANFFSIKLFNYLTEYWYFNFSINNNIYIYTFICFN